jgi:hypothetical protein
MVTVPSEDHDPSRDSHTHNTRTFFAASAAALCAAVGCCLPNTMSLAILYAFVSGPVRQSSR